ncbi:MAG: hypothetical protein ABSE86_15770 [Bryobacteraceae bacterium]|jgi:hypothetical protein
MAAGMNGTMDGAMINRTSRKLGTRKAKKSFTLSDESCAFLDAMRKRRRTSASSILEEMLQAFRREQGKAALDKAVADYYSSLSQQESEEQTEWGEFALGEFPRGGV